MLTQCLDAGIGSGDLALLSTMRDVHEIIFLYVESNLTGFQNLSGLYFLYVESNLTGFQNLSGLYNKRFHSHT